MLINPLFCLIIVITTTIYFHNKYNLYNLNGFVKLIFQITNKMLLSRNKRISNYILINNVLNKIIIMLYNAPYYYVIIPKSNLLKIYFAMISLFFKYKF